MAELSTRETIATLLLESTALREAGLPEGAVFQADTFESPEVRPFIAIRWLDEEPGLAHVTRRPFSLWGYDKMGDFSRIEKIIYVASQELGSVEQIKTISGWLNRIETSGVGLGRGADMADLGLDAMVEPYNLRAIASGV